MIRTELAIDPRTGIGFRSVFDTETCTPVEPIQRFLNYCGKRQLAQNTIDTYAYRLCFEPQKRSARRHHSPKK